MARAIHTLVVCSKCGLEKDHARNNHPEKCPELEPGEKAFWEAHESTTEWQ